MSQSDNSLKIFDVANFDLIHFVKLKFSPNLVEFIAKQSAFSSVVAVTSGTHIYLLKPEHSDTPFKVLKDLHYAPITCLKYIPELGLCISADNSGLIEIWDPETGEFPTEE